MVKIGSSSVTDEQGQVDDKALAKLCSEVAELSAAGERVVIVTSGAIAAGLRVLELRPRPSDLSVLQAVSAVGQSRLMAHYERALAAEGLVGGQVLLAPLDFMNRAQYLHARQTLHVLLGLGVVPVINENDAVADDEVRFGDNDRLAALVAILIVAARLVMLTDTPGLFTSDPTRFDDATLIEEVSEFDRSLEAAAGGPASGVGTGGMASKLAAARLAAWSGIETVVADARARDVLVRLEAGGDVDATRFRPRARPLAARKAWIAFATAPRGRVTIDAGAHRALRGGASLLLAGLRQHVGEFFAGDAVEVVCDGELVAKGLVRQSSAELAGVGTGGPAPRDVVVVHRDDLVVLD